MIAGNSKYFHTIKWRNTLLIGVSGALIGLLGLVCLVGLNFPNFSLIAGILEIAGAFILALPDLKLYRRWFYAGHLKAAQHEFDFGLNDGQYIDSEVDWYDAFYEFVDKKQVIPPRDLPKRRIERNKDPWFGPKVIGGTRLFVTEGFEGNTGRVSYKNFKDRLNREIAKYDASIRRSGITLLALGFAVQVLGSFLALAGVFD